MKISKRIIGIALTYLVLNNSLLGQISIDNFFNDKNIDVDSAERQPPRMLYSSFKMPWIEDVDLRTETDEFDFDRQEYTFRFSPNSVKKKRAQELLLRHIYEVPDYRLAELVCEDRMSKYEDWLSLYLIYEEEQILKRLEPLLNDNEKIITKKSVSLDFDFVDMIRITQRKADLKLAKLDLNTEKDIISNRNGLSKTDNTIDLEFDFENFIAIDELIEKIELVPSEHYDPSYANEKNNYEYDLLQKEMNLEIAEGKQIFDFGQIRYAGPHSDLFEERLSIGIGLNISNSGNSRLKIRELEMEQKELLLKGELEVNKKSLSASLIKTELITLINAYKQREVILLKEEQKLEQIANLASEKEGFDPSILIDIELKKLSRSEESLKWKNKIYDKYLEYLEDSQIACQSEVQFLMK